MMTLDYLPSNAALLDHGGKIMSVNQRWRQFATDNGWTLPNAGVGCNYLDICEAGIDDVYAALAYISVVKVLCGQVESDSFIYPCHSPTHERWFCCKISHWINDQVLVMHFLTRHAICARQLDLMDNPAQLEEAIEEHRRLRQSLSKPRIPTRNPATSSSVDALNTELID